MATASVTNTPTNGQTVDGPQLATNFSDLVGFLNSDVVHVDGSKAFTAVQSGITPTADAHLATKKYVDDKGVTAQIYLAAAQSIPHGSLTTVKFDTQNYASPDTTNFTYNLSTGVITVVNAGTYRIEVNAGLAANATGYRRLNILNTGTSRGDVSQNAVSGEATRLHLSVTRALLASATIEAQLFQNSGGALNSTSGSTSAWLTVTRVS